MKDWGIPDWKDASAYGDTSNWDWYRLRWEFLRRQQGIRDFFDRHAEDHYQSMLRARDYAFSRHHPLPHTEEEEERYFASVIQPDQPGFSIPEPENIFRLNAVPNPRISEQPTGLLHYISDGKHSVEYYLGQFYRDVKLNMEGPNKVAVVFDVDAPIPGQVKYVKDILHKVQSDRHGEKLISREHQDKWLVYLRVLDARECGASLSEIASILSNSKADAQTARDVLQQAKAVRDKI